MTHPKIRLACRIIIDSSCIHTWEKYIFEDTYREYNMQQQLFNDKDKPADTFRELLAENPKAEQLHFLTGMAAQPYIAQLRGSYYRITDTLGSTFFPFENYRLDIINTSLTDGTKHKIGLTFYTPLLTFLGIVNNHYLVSLQAAEKAGYDTCMFALQDRLGISYYEGHSLLP